MISEAGMSRISVNPNHFLPKSLIDAPMWYTSSSISRKRSCALLNRSILTGGYILSVVTVNIQLEPVAYTLCVDSGSHSFFPFVEQGQYRIIHIVINQRNGAFCLSYQVRYKTVSVKHLPVVEYTLHGRDIGFQSFEHLEGYWLPVV